MASRFWVGGAGTWDASDTTHWAASSGGAGGQSVPGASDTATFDGSSGGGTVTVNTDFTIATLTMGAFTGTLTFATNNNSPTIGSFSVTGAGARTLNLGSGTFTLTGLGGASAWDSTTTTNLTFNAGTSVLSFTGATSKTFATGGLSYATVSAAGAVGASLITTGAPTIATFTISAGNSVRFAGGVTTTISNAPTWAGTSSAGILIEGNGSSLATVAISSGSPSIQWASLRGITFTGTSGFAYNSIVIGSVTGITVVTAAIKPSYQIGAF
jgi:hypothetical protein